MDYDANRICQHTGVRNGKKCLRKVSLKDIAHSYKFCGIHYCHHREKALDKKLLEIMSEEETTEPIETTEPTDLEKIDEETEEKETEQIKESIKAEILKKIKLLLESL